MAVAWIGFAGAVAAALLSGLVAVRQSRMEERLLRLGRELDAEQVLTRYRQPLATAAFDLQARLYNILELDFVGQFGREHARAAEAARTTLFRIAQYFGWSEILRRDVQFLSFVDHAASREVARLQARVSDLFLDSALGETLMIWRDEQRAIGELMIAEEHGTVLCMGYARFSECCDERFAPWLDRLWAELQQPEALPRMRLLQHALCDLVQALDVHELFAAEQLRPAVEAQPSPGGSAASTNRSTASSAPGT